LLICRWNQSLTLPRCLKILLSVKGVRLDSVNSYGYSALSLLCRYYPHNFLIDCVQLLIDHEVNVDKLDRNERTALQLLSEYYKGDNLIEIASLLVSKILRFRMAEKAVDILRVRGLVKESKNLAKIIQSRRKDIAAAKANA